MNFVLLKYHQELVLQEGKVEDIVKEKVLIQMLLRNFVKEFGLHNLVNMEEEKLNFVLLALKLSLKIIKIII